LLRLIAFTIIAISSLAISIVLWGTLLISCSGHADPTAIGGWIIPASLLGAALFSYLASITWRMRRVEQPTLISVELQNLFRKIVKFSISLIVAALFYFLFSRFILSLWGTGLIPNWGVVVVNVVQAVLSFYIGHLTYQTLGKYIPLRSSS
jgi:O-antigen/teichoic acid export membrane protein